LEPREDKKKRQETGTSSSKFTHAREPVRAQKKKKKKRVEGGGRGAKRGTKRNFRVQKEADKLRRGSVTNVGGQQRQGEKNQTGKAGKVGRVYRKEGAENGPSN